MKKLLLVFSLSLFAGNKMDPTPSIKDAIEQHNKAAACSGQKESSFRQDLLVPLEKACSDKDKRQSYNYMKCMAAHFCEKAPDACEQPIYTHKCQRAMRKAFEPLNLKDPEITLRNFEKLNNKAKYCAGQKFIGLSKTTITALTGACSWDDMQTLEDHANCEVAKHCVKDAKSCQYAAKNLSKECNKAIKDANADFGLQPAQN